MSEITKKLCEDSHKNVMGTCTCSTGPWCGICGYCDSCKRKDTGRPLYHPKKANFGCGPIPLYPQDIRYMGEDWQSWLLIDKFIKQDGIVNWDIEDLSKIPDGYLEEIYCSHALEHISHRKLQEVLSLWHSKLAQGGKLVINVPDLMYALKQLRKLENDQVPDDLYNTFYGLHGVMSIIYGTHSQEGEYHLSGFTTGSLTNLLQEVGFSHVDVKELYDDHQMGVLIATAIK